MPGPVPARRRFRVRDRSKARQSVNQKESTPRCRRTAPERSHTRASCPPAQRHSIGSLVLPLRCMLHFCTLQSAHGPSFKLVLLVFGPIPMPFCPSPSPSGPRRPFQPRFALTRPKFWMHEGHLRHLVPSRAGHAAHACACQTPGHRARPTKVDVASRFHFPATVFGAFSYVVG